MSNLVDLVPNQLETAYVNVIAIRLHESLKLTDEVLPLLGFCRSSKFNFRKHILFPVLKAGGPTELMSRMLKKKPDSIKSM